jgi:hypothetical protein|tara:strand:+ start:346 stop:501 length:156 start_codon:yes stop_codon:yes gene_type:complete
MKNKKHKELIDDYEVQKSNHLERLATKSLAADEKFRKLRDKKVKGDFLKNF